MAILVPVELDLDDLHPESERNVIRQLLVGLDDDWYVAVGPQHFSSARSSPILIGSRGIGDQYGSMSGMRRDSHARVLWASTSIRCRARIFS